MADHEPVHTPHATLQAELVDLESHIKLLVEAEDPLPLVDEALLDRINYQLGPASYPSVTQQFLPRVALVAKKIADMPETPSANEKSDAVLFRYYTALERRGFSPPLLTLATKLLRPVAFDGALELCTAEYLSKALCSQQPQINEFALDMLEKATAMPSYATLLAANPSLLRALLDRTLISDSVEVGQRGVRIIGDLLDVDCPRAQPSFTDEQRSILDLRLIHRRINGHGSVWRRLFGQPVDNFLLKTLQAINWRLFPASSDNRSILKSRTIAQSRVLDLIPRIMVLDPQPLIEPDAAIAPSLLGPDATLLSPSDRPVSLLEWITVEMVDRRNDMLMHMTWIDYMKRLVGVMRVADTELVVAPTLGRLISMVQDPVMVSSLWTMPDTHFSASTGEAAAMKEYLEEVAPRTSP